jgi:hypothetical protein
MEPPPEFICSLTMDLMLDPVVTKYGHSYERSAILQWLGRGNDTCPMSRRPLRLSDIITNHALRVKIRRWQVEQEEDVTIFCNSYDDRTTTDETSRLFFGFLTLPEADPEPTERSHDDSDTIVEQQPVVVVRRRRTAPPRTRFLGIFPARRAAAA